MITDVQPVNGAGLRLLFAPARTYRELVATATGSPWWGSARRLLLISLVIGTSVTMAATESVHAGDVLAMTFWWSMAPLIQLLGAVVLVRSVRNRPVATSRGVELMLAAHVLWSLWLLGIVPLIALDARRALLIGSLLPVIPWRMVLLYHFCRTVLGCSRIGAVARTVLHQSVIVAVILVYVAWAVAYSARTG
jgi:hypothetical protein